MSHSSQELFGGDNSLALGSETCWRCQGRAVLYPLKLRGAQEHTNAAWCDSKELWSSGFVMGQTHQNPWVLLIFLTLLPCVSATCCNPACRLRTKTITVRHKTSPSHWRCEWAVIFTFGSILKFPGYCNIQSYLLAWKGHIYSASHHCLQSTVGIKNNRSCIFMLQIQGEQKLGKRMCLQNDKTVNGAR